MSSSPSKRREGFALAVALVAMTATGAYAYRNIKQLNRYETSDEREKFSADYERKYLKYEKLPQPSVARVKLDVQLYPKQRMLLTEGACALVNKSNLPIKEVHVRKGDDDVEWLKLDVAGVSPRRTEPVSSADVIT